MKKTELINIIETLAPLDTQEPWITTKLTRLCYV